MRLNFLSVYRLRLSKNTNVRPFPEVFFYKSAKSMDGVYIVSRVWDFTGLDEREKITLSWLRVLACPTSAVGDRDWPEVRNHRWSIKNHEDDENETTVG